MRIHLKQVFASAVPNLTYCTPAYRNHYQNVHA